LWNGFNFQSDYPLYKKLLWGRGDLNPYAFRHMILSQHR